MRPNVLYIFADQWRAQATGYAGDPNVRTPNLDRLAGESIDFHRAVSGTPVCTPARATLLTGQYALTHGVFVNDVRLDPEARTLGKVFKEAGYRTAYVGKWHLDGQERSAFIPEERQHGFDYWKALDCTHDYNDSKYFEDNDPAPRKWDGYDAFAQAEDVISYLKSHDGSAPFFLTLSFGPPHDPYHTAPEAFRALYDPAAIELRPNVPEEQADYWREQLAGYYAHCSALDHAIGRVVETLDELGLADDTILVVSSDHGDMLGSHGAKDKQQPYDESIRIPLLLRWPRRFGRAGRKDGASIDVIDHMPTLLGLAGAPIPESVEGRDFSGYLADGSAGFRADEALLACPHPFGQWNRDEGGREFRGVRTERYTYVRDLDGPWLLFDNANDPYQTINRVDDPACRSVREALEERLRALLDARGDGFRPGMEYIREWGYPVDATGTVPYSW